MELAFALILVVAVVGEIFWRITRKTSAGGSGSSGGSGRSGAHRH